MAEQPEQGGESGAKAAPKGRINLDRASILLIDNSWGVEILTRIFVGFGARQLHRADTLDKAAEVLAKMPVDLIVTEAMIDNQDIYDFVRDLRLNADNDRNRFTPVILLSAHTGSGKIAEARDCGANFFVAKPLSPKVVMNRVLWVANGKRQYLQTDTYAGPDRRFRNEPLPPGMVGRRRGDTSEHLDLEEKSA